MRFLNLIWAAPSLTAQLDRTRTDAKRAENWPSARRLRGSSVVAWNERKTLRAFQDRSLMASETLPSVKDESIRNLILRHSIPRIISCPLRT
jgi:hypothetical protein